MIEQPPKDPPITPLEYLSGVKVIDIGDLRVARGMSRRPSSSCGHASMHYDPHERRIWCPDCETNIDPFDAFVRLVSQLDTAKRQLGERAEKVAEAETHTLISRAAKVVDQAWRSRGMTPCCPHCRGALLPEDFLHGFASVSTEIERHRRAALGPKP